MIGPIVVCTAMFVPQLAVAEPTLMRTPFGGTVPSVVVFKGTVYVLFGKDSNAFCTQSHDYGITFSPPVQVNHRPNSVTVGGERGPKALVTQDGTLHVLWLGDYRKGGGLWYTRSRDNGHTFEPERNLEDRPAGCDGAAIAGQGRRLFAFWLDSRGGEDSQNPVTGTLVMATSADGGMSWSPTQEVRYDFPGRPCACCRLEAKVGPGDIVTVVFRTGYHNIRDFYMLRATPSELPRMACRRVSTDEWRLEGCPMMGASLVAQIDGSAIIAWMARGRVYWRWVLPHGRIGDAVPVPGAGIQRYPTFVDLGSGKQVLLWREAERICWVEIAKGAQASQRRGTLPSRGSNAFGAFVDPRGRIVIVD